MSAKRILDVTPHSKLGIEFHWLEILYVFGIKEHVPNDCLLFMDF